MCVVRVGAGCTFVVYEGAVFKLCTVFGACAVGGFDAFFVQCRVQVFCLVEVRECVVLVVFYYVFFVEGCTFVKGFIFVGVEVVCIVRGYVDIVLQCIFFVFYVVGRVRIVCRVHVLFVHGGIFLELCVGVGVGAVGVIGSHTRVFFGGAEFESLIFGGFLTVRVVVCHAVVVG